MNNITSDFHFNTIFPYHSTDRNFSYEIYYLKIVFSYYFAVKLCQRKF